ncbi:hypothetical protein DAMA08_050990 [Martiniozyma asiatica (nom. inval.)]|nr:hypothetical protein DAMA08_050990 [Martiniozyma asiatica]
MGGKKKSKAPAAAPAADSDSDWEDGAKKQNKKQLEKDAKKEEQLLKKKEREAMLAAEEASLPSKKGGKTQSHKKKNGLDNALNQIDADGLDDAISALSLLKKDAVGDHEIDRHPERRFKAALKEYTERRTPELKKENPGLRKQQIEQLIYKEFQKAPENPFNAETNISYNASKSDVDSLKKNIKDKRSKKFER